MSVDLNRTKTRDAARGKWRGIFITLGMDEKFLKKEHGPCPCCGGKDRFRFDDLEGNGTFYCTGCEIPSGTGFALLKNWKGWPFEKAAREVDAIVGNITIQEYKAKRESKDIREYLKKLRNDSKLIRPGDPAWTYLESRCGDIRGMVDKLRLHPGLKHSVDGGTYPVLLSPMRNTGDPVGCGYHRTFLTADGRKAPVTPAKMNLGDAAPIELGPVMPRMGIAEGIESALCATQMFGAPVWSAGCADGVSKWAPPESASHILICGDNDANFVGQAAAYALAKRLVHEHRNDPGFKVEVLIPSEVGTDWADVFAQMQVAA